jgi:hypothetical protein
MAGTSPAMTNMRLTNCTSSNPKRDCRRFL